MTAQQLLPIGLAFIMFAVGTGLNLTHFKQVLAHPKSLFVGLANQIVLLPIIALFIASFYTGPVEFAFGLMILAACPGGITSNLLSVLAGGNAALSVCMTAITSLCSIITVPVILGLSYQFLVGEGTTITMPVGRVMGGIFLITALPIALGMVLKAKKPDLCEKHQRGLRRTATVIFALIVAGAFIANKDNIATHFLDVGLDLITLNIATICFGFLSAFYLKSSPPEQITISIECGLQNVALAIFLAINVLEKPELMVPAIIYAVIMNVSAIVLIVLARKFFTKRPSLA
ncbi:Predicted Na+-dependent transporter [Candidatus Terasakiella magnetica]|uniref:Predicted Na+-dependent transporter n=1 Tax=Candidatus Terasakiella magnetica TaxID=1867952 RepID=A0A1C3RBV6_9PROT|nr:bile acid:sodium symporter family protein [Candidatus Terasakiella magnetica]SCA54766.1 Predicted Na+-dependent transporter [Candidatus Terasakiella magnetica]